MAINFQTEFMKNAWVVIVLEIEMLITGCHNPAAVSSAQLCRTPGNQSLENYIERTLGLPDWRIKLLQGSSR